MIYIYICMSIYVIVTSYGDAAAAVFMLLYVSHLRYTHDVLFSALPSRNSEYIKTITAVSKGRASIRATKIFFYFF